MTDRATLVLILHGVGERNVRECHLTGVKALIDHDLIQRDKPVTIEQELARAADSMYARTAEKTSVKRYRIRETTPP